MLDGRGTETARGNDGPINRTLATPGAAVRGRGGGHGAAALVGWAADQPVLLGLRASYIPMAPEHGAGVPHAGAGPGPGPGGRPPRGRMLGGLGGAAVTLIAAVRLIEFAARTDFEVDRWFFHVRTGTFGLAPLGKMSLPTAAAFLAAGAAVMALAPASRCRRGGGRRPTWPACAA